MNETINCDDGNPCTDEKCVDGICVHTTVTCPETSGCSVSRCDINLGCVVTDALNCDDGDMCTTDSCSDGKCVHVADVICDSDENQCTDDTCLPYIGCIYNDISRTKCDDKNACTVDSCDPKNGCSHSEISCDDGISCTADSCDQSKGCVHEDTCNSADPCTSAFCDKISGKCVTIPKICDDGNNCTTDTCDPNVGCVFAPRNCPSDPFDKCSEGKCISGACKITPINCDDRLICTNDYCHPYLGCMHDSIFGCTEISQNSAHDDSDSDLNSDSLSPGAYVVIGTAVGVVVTVVVVLIVVSLRKKKREVI